MIVFTIFRLIWNLMECREEIGEEGVMDGKGEEWGEREGRGEIERNASRREV